MFAYTSLLLTFFSPYFSPLYHFYSFPFYYSLMLTLFSNVLHHIHSYSLLFLYTFTFYLSHSSTHTHSLFPSSTDTHINKHSSLSLSPPHLLHTHCLYLTYAHTRTLCLFLSSTCTHSLSLSTQLLHIHTLSLSHFCHFPSSIHTLFLPLLIFYTDSLALF